ncbi:MAG: BlaI/MecI/CopY family transcriptional regulator [Bacteroidetes bacterium]|jgi:BlaI family transcriptional regulator, penicillinase repressor|nr:MAG: BlaI/MecI/CopY family transcriptional regulator [Bacteroidota bacterium]
MESRLLTTLELKVMNILWAEKKALVRDMITHWPEQPRPAYNTVSTIVRILEEKGFVAHESLGRSHAYYPLITRSKYQQRMMRHMMDNVFSGSVTGMVSTLLDQRKMSPDELQELRDLISQSEKE